MTLLTKVNHITLKGNIFDKLSGAKQAFGTLSALGNEGNAQEITAETRFSFVPFSNIIIILSIDRSTQAQGSIVPLFERYPHYFYLHFCRSTQADVVMFSGCKDYQTSADTNVSGFGATGAASFAFVNTVRRAHYHHHHIS